MYTYAILALGHVPRETQIKLTQLIRNFLQALTRNLAWTKLKTEPKNFYRVRQMTMIV